MENIELTEVSPEAGISFDRSDRIAAWLMLVAGYFFCRFFGGTSRPLGAALLIVVVYALTLIYCLIHNRENRSAKLFVLPAVAFVLAAGLFITSVPICRFLIAAEELFMYFYWVYCSLEGSGEGIPGKMFFFEMLKSVFALPFPAMGRLFKAIGGKKNRKKDGHGTFGWIILGILIAAVPTVIIMLLLSYDEAFVGLLDKIGGFLPDIRFSTVFCVIFGIPVAMLGFGLLHASRNKEKSDLFTREDCEKAGQKARFAPMALCITAVTPALIVYVLFFISQIESYLLPFIGQKPDGMFYAEYARSGFFELCAVAAINAVMITVMSVFMKRKKERPAVLRIYEAVYAIFTLLLILTAMLKMFLYVREFGLTRLRVQTCVFMLWLAVCFASVLLKAAINKVNVIGSVICSAVLLLGATSLVDIDRMIADYNVDGYLDGRLDSMDIDLFYSLGEGAVEPCVRLMETPGVDREIKERAENYLQITCDGIYNYEDGIWNVSLPRLIAKKALKDAGISPQNLDIEDN